MATIMRAQIAHTPRSPFVQDGALQAFSDGAVAYYAGRILSTRLYNNVRAGYPEAEVLDARYAFLLPGSVDCRVPFPQIRGEESVAEVRVVRRVVFSRGVS